jgi:hypothetical protein
MLLELAAANAAFNVIKQALANGKDLSDMGSKVFDYFDNKAKIQQKVTEKGNRSDIEEFFALEKLNAQEVELRERMVYAGRPGMWADWQKFQGAAARRRREEKEAEIKAIRVRKEKMERLIEYLVLGLASIILSALIVYGVYIYMVFIRK